MNPRLLFGLGIAVAVLMIYAIVDCALIERSRIRGLPRAAWLLVILIPVAGALLWLLVGRGRRAGASAAHGRSVAPDDDPEFLGRLGRDAAQEERIRRLEQELADLDDLETLDDEGDTGHLDDPDHRTDGDKPGRTDA